MAEPSSRAQITRIRRNPQSEKGYEQVRHHGLPLAAAQHEIAANWYSTWVAASRPGTTGFRLRQRDRFR